MLQCYIPGPWILKHLHILDTRIDYTKVLNFHRIKLIDPESIHRGLLSTENGSGKQRPMLSSPALRSAEKML
jgi:hypothetical protein